MLDTYATIFGEYEGGIVEKKSKFIANIFHVENEQQAKERINEIKKKHYDAKHHVYAYRIYSDNVFEKFSDDGEPAQTAGKPIADLIKQKNIYNVLIVVTRYFGGVLLGTGGLTRAYTQAANICLNNTSVEEMIYSKIVMFKTNYDELDKVKYYCDTNNIIIEKIEYLENILFEIIVKDKEYDNFAENMNNLLSRKVEFTILSQKYVKK